MSDKNNPSMYERIMSVDGEKLRWSGVLSVLEEMEKKIEELQNELKVVSNFHPTDVQEPHDTILGYCCACEYDVLKTEQLIKDKRTQVLNEVIARIKEFSANVKGNEDYSACYDDCITICNQLKR